MAEIGTAGVNDQLLKGQRGWVSRILETPTEVWSKIQKKKKYSKIVVIVN